MPYGEELEAMLKEVREAKAEELTDCPQCGWSLHRLSDGTLHCPFDGFTTGGSSSGYGGRRDH